MARARQYADRVNIIKMVKVNGNQLRDELVGHALT